MDNTFKTHIVRICSRILLLLSISNMAAQNLDINLLRDINLNRNKSLDPTFRTITNSVGPVSIGAPVLIYTLGLLRHDASLKEKGLYLGETFVGTTVFALALKYTTKRDRPFITYPDIEKETSGGGYSMPSGHTSDAFATATSLSIAFPKWYVIAPSFVWAGAVGYSRMDLGVHYPSDVVAGAVLGSGTAYLTYKLNQWINKRHKEATIL